MNWLKERRAGKRGGKRDETRMAWCEPHWPLDTNFETLRSRGRLKLGMPWGAPTPESGGGGLAGEPVAQNNLKHMSVYAENPENFSQAAHSLRELMEKIGPFLGIAIQDLKLKKGEGNLNDKFYKIETLLSKAEAKSKNFNGGAWSGVRHAELRLSTCG
jgi:hypothetical protein